MGNPKAVGSTPRFIGSSPPPLAGAASAPYRGGVGADPLMRVFSQLLLTWELVAAHLLSSSTATERSRRTFGPDDCVRRWFFGILSINCH